MRPLWWAGDPDGRGGSGRGLRRDGRVDAISGEGVLDHHRRGPDDTGLVARRGRDDLQPARRERQGPAVDDLADSGDEALARLDRSCPVAARRSSARCSLNAIGYDGPISIEWEDAGMDRLVGAPEALEEVRRLNFEPPAASFDAAFSSNRD
jgi:hypothetical protein